MTGKGNTKVWSSNSLKMLYTSLQVKHDIVGTFLPPPPPPPPPPSHTEKNWTFLCNYKEMWYFLISSLSPYIIGSGYFDVKTSPPSPFWPKSCRKAEIKTLLDFGPCRRRPKIFLIINHLLLPPSVSITS